MMITKAQWKAIKQLAKEPVFCNSEASIELCPKCAGIVAAREVVAMHKRERNAPFAAAALYKLGVVSAREAKGKERKSIWLLK